MSQKTYYHALWHKFHGEILKNQAELSTYINTPVGVGEHSDILEEIETKVKKINEYEGYLETLDTIFSEHFLDPFRELEKEIVKQSEENSEVEEG